MTSVVLDAESPAETDAGRWIDRVCRQFERDWRLNGQRPLIEDLLKDAPSPMRRKLLEELLAVELEIRVAIGDTVRIEDYKRRFLSDEATVERAWSEHLADLGEFAIRGREILPQRFGDYRVVREIGRGGMGIVFEAQQESLE